jgi:hypothetical protein
MFSFLSDFWWVVLRCICCLRLVISTLTKSTVSSLKIISSRSIKISSTRTANIFRKYYNKITSSSTKGKSNTYLKKNPTPPTLNAQLKLHKPNIPIRPVVNNKNAPAYKTAKTLNDILKQCLCLDNRYNIINSTSLANDIVKLSINNKHRMITYDVKGLYTNVPIDKTLKITEIQLLKNNDKHKTKQIITILKSILAQNYFTFHDTIYHPNKGVVMGPPYQARWRKYSYNI